MSAERNEVIAVHPDELDVPFLHVHEHEETQRHQGGFFQTHFPHHHPLSASKSPELRGLDPDDDAVYQQRFSALCSLRITSADQRLTINACQKRFRRSRGPNSAWTKSRLVGQMTVQSATPESRAI